MKDEAVRKDLFEQAANCQCEYNKYVYEMNNKIAAASLQEKAKLLQQNSTTTTTTTTTNTPGMPILAPKAAAKSGRPHPKANANIVRPAVASATHLNNPPAPAPAAKVAMANVNIAQLTNQIAQAVGKQPKTAAKSVATASGTGADANRSTHAHVRAWISQ